jgi:hypothetical protein
MAMKRDAAWLLIALFFGVLILPLLVYFTGTLLLGPYAKGGPGAFLAGYLADLASLRWISWTLALGPLVIAAIWRAAVKVR